MEVLGLVSQMGHQEVVFCHDAETKLKAIIAVHDTTLGPALGGCRMWDYASEEEAITDVLRLSRGMTYKAAVAGLHLGGGKSVIIGRLEDKTPEMFHAFGTFVQGLSGRYITAEDVNVRVSDMDEVAKETKYVTGITSRPGGGSGDPSPFTAFGVFQGIRAAAKYKLGRADLKGVRVAVQGCGAVGRNLCDLLAEAGAQLIVSDIATDLVEKTAARHQAQMVDTGEVHRVDCEIFAPCALGAGLNPDTIDEIKAPVVAGGANNQLANEDRDGEALRKRDILYAPDYVINAGGLINVSHELRGYDRDASMAETAKIYDTLLRVFAEADRRELPTHQASAYIAEERIAETKKRQANRNFRNTFENQEWIRV